MKVTIFVKQTEDGTCQLKLQKSGLLLNTYHYFGKKWGEHQIDGALHQKIINPNEEKISDWLTGFGYTVVIEEDIP
jgi:phage-related protein